MSTKIDLHIHTRASDGTDSPRVLIKKIAGLLGQGDEAVVAITDHDTTDGIPEYFSEANKYDTITAIGGIEISTDYHGQEVHMLGYGIDLANESLTEVLHSLKESRENRSKHMVEKLNAGGYDISYEDLLSKTVGAVSRPHIATALMEKGYVSSVKEAFKTLIGKDSEFYVERKKITPQEAIHLIRNAGGIPVLAHIMLYDKLNREEKVDLVKTLVEEGLSGIETYYSTYSEEDIRFVEGLAKEFSLLRTGGSDYHGSIKPHINLFTGTGSLKVPEDILSDFLDKPSNE